MESCDYCGEECPHVNECLTPEQLGEGVKFERLRRITGYLVGDTSRWNNGKYAELQDRVKHEDT